MGKFVNTILDPIWLSASRSEKTLTIAAPPCKPSIAMNNVTNLERDCAALTVSSQPVSQRPQSKDVHQASGAKIGVCIKCSRGVWSSLL